MNDPVPESSISQVTIRQWWAAREQGYLRLERERTDALRQLTQAQALRDYLVIRASRVASVSAYDLQPSPLLVLTREAFRRAWEAEQARKTGKSPCPEGAC